MASRFYASLKTVRGRILLTSTTLGAGALTAGELRRRQNNGSITPAEAQFSTSSVHPIPQGWTGSTWAIRNDYPTAPAAATPVLNRAGGGAGGGLPTLPGPSVPPPVGDPRDDAPWLSVDFNVNPLLYCAIIKEYCWEGNVNNGFVVQKNRVRNWYHAPWMHYGDHGREPLNGLTYERSVPTFELSRTQGRYLQNWACGYYNAAGASLFGKVWANPDSPQWTGDLQFPEGTAVFKVLLTDATDQEVPTMSGAPSLKAVIAPPGPNPVKKAADPKTRNNFASDMRLIQVDFAVRDDRAPIGWVFGTFMYNGNLQVSDPWDRLTPVGIMWGNDPTLNQAAADAGRKPVESWINPEAERLRLSLGGGRPSWGWNGRLAGPADNFISSCASCHSVAQRNGSTGMTPSPPPKLVNGKWVPPNDTKLMNWFRDIPSGTPFDRGAGSSDYSLQLMIGYNNYKAWVQSQSNAVMKFIRGAVAVPGKAFGFEPPLGSKERREGLREGPDMQYEQKPLPRKQ